MKAHQVIVRVCDIGCLDNALPVAGELIRRGVGVGVYRDIDSISHEKHLEGFDFVDLIPPGVLALSCLPLGDGYEQLKAYSNPVVLVQENPDPADQRFSAWSDVNVQCTCTIFQPSLPGVYAVTGLPSIDTVVLKIKSANRTKICRKIGINPAEPTVTLALPGYEAGCMRMVEAIGETKAVIVARSHHKLKRDDPEGYVRVSDTVDSLSSVSLEHANGYIGPLESIALAMGEGNHFVGTHDTTMNWQAAAAGVYNLHVMPPADDDGNWAVESPIITTTFGRVFDGQLVPHKPNRSFLIDNSTAKIADIVQELASHKFGRICSIGFRPSSV